MLHHLNGIASMHKKCKQQQSIILLNTLTQVLCSKGLPTSSTTLTPTTHLLTDPSAAFPKHLVSPAGWVYGYSMSSLHRPDIPPSVPAKIG